MHENFFYTWSADSTTTSATHNSLLNMFSAAQQHVSYDLFLFLTVSIVKQPTTYS